MPVVTITKIGVNGEGIGFEKSTPILLYGAIPGDVAEYRVTERTGKMIRGKIVRLVEKSPHRKEPSCAHFGKCDGCPLMIADYKAQLDWKKEEVLSNLRKVPGVDLSLVKDCIPNEKTLGYRNLVKLPVTEHKGKLVNALYERGTNRLVPVLQCPVHEPELERVRKAVLEVLNRYHVRAFDRKTKQGLRTLYLRGMNGKFQLALIGGKEPYDGDCVKELMDIPGMNSIYQNINAARETRELFGKQSIHLAGTKALSFKVGKTHLCLSLPSFYQMNTAQAEKLYEIAVGMIPENTEHLVEAYCGIGAMSFLAKDRAKRIDAIEFAGSSIRDAKEALKRNDAPNIRFTEGDAAKEYAKIAKKDPADCLLVDPPRTGLNEEMIETIHKAKPETIVYVSCNPYTLSKNIADLKEYQVQKAVPVDIFSQTPHVETVVLLSRK